LASSSICRHSWGGSARTSRPWRGTAKGAQQMPQAQFDCVIRNGRVATAVDGISNGVIVAIGRGLGKGEREIDAAGRLVLPGGIDAHAHIEQLSAAGIVNSDTFESATVSAAHGGTTTAICFAAQHRGMDLKKVTDDYMGLA